MLEQMPLPESPGTEQALSSVALEQMLSPVAHGTEQESLCMTLE